MTFKIASTRAALFVLALTAAVAPAHAVSPMIPEARVNEIVAGDQSFPVVAAAPSGAFVIAWQSEGVGGSLTDIFARLYGPNGQPLGDQFLVNTTTANRQVFPAVAMNASGDFVIAWDSLGQNGVPGIGVYAQRFNADGTPKGTEFHVNDGKRDAFTRIGVAMDGNGDFVIVWPERKTPLPVATTVKIASINALTYGPDGVPLTTQFEVGTSVPTNLRIPAVGMSANGDFVVAWQGDATQFLPVNALNTDNGGIFVRRYSLAGTAYAAAVQVDNGSAATGLGRLAAPTQFSDRPAIAVGGAGDFTVVWQRNLVDFTPSGLFARRYDVNGAALGAEFRVGPASQALRFPGVAVDPQGRVTVVAHDEGIFAQRYAADGSTLGSELRLDDGLATTALLPAVATDAAGHFIVTWQDFARDGDGRGIVMRQYKP